MLPVARSFQQSGQPAGNSSLCADKVVSIRVIVNKKMTPSICSVQFSSRWYLCAQKSPCALHPISCKFPQCRRWNGSIVCLINNGPQVASPAPQHFRSSEKQAICEGMLCPKISLNINDVQTSLTAEKRRYLLVYTLDIRIWLPFSVDNYYKRGKRVSSLYNLTSSYL